MNLIHPDVAAIRDYPRLEACAWFTGDVPVRTWRPVVDAIDKPPPPLLRPEAWLDSH